MSGVNNVDYIKGAVEEYIDTHKRKLEKLQKTIPDLDIERELIVAREKIEEYLKVNNEYAMLMMELAVYKDKENDSSDYVSLTVIAKLKNPKNPSYVIQNWLRNRNTIEFLSSWETKNNPKYSISGLIVINKKISDPSFSLTVKIWKRFTNATGIISKQGNGGGTYAHIDIAIDFYIWAFPDKRYELIRMILGKASFLEKIKEELKIIKV